MEITEVRIKLMEESEDRLRAFCSITFDSSFVVRDLKIIEGTQGPFVAMPSRKLTNRCSRCGNKNAMRSNYCNNCGVRLRDSRDTRDDDTPNKLYADVAHPINQACRDMIQQHVVAEYTLELDRAKLPGYASRYDDSYDAGEISSDYQDPRFIREEESHVKGPHFRSRDQSVERQGTGPNSTGPNSTGQNSSGQNSSGPNSKGPNSAGQNSDTAPNEKNRQG